MPQERFVLEAQAPCHYGNAQSYARLWRDDRATDAIRSDQLLNHIGAAITVCTQREKASSVRRVQTSLDPKNKTIFERCGSYCKGVLWVAQQA